MLNLFNDFDCAFTIELLQRELIASVFGDTNRHNRQRQHIWAAVDEFANSSFQFLTVIKTCTENNLSVILNTGSL